MGLPIVLVMKHVTFGEKAILVGDDAADALLEYARVIGDAGTADTVTLNAIGPDGNTVEVGILLNSSTSLIVEGTNSDVRAPENDEAVAEMRERIEALTRPLTAQPDEGWTHDEYESTEIF